MEKKVCLIGSGNWASAIARIIGTNVLNSQKFSSQINMWVYEEEIDGKKLSEIINTIHENVKYLPGYKLPENVIAVPDLLQAVHKADILIFCVPHQFLGNILPKIKEQGVNMTATAISLIKGIDYNEQGIVLISDMIREALNIECSVLMGANVANEVAAGDFCEATLGCSSTSNGPTLQELFDSANFSVQVTMDTHGVELCGALKNIVALGAGFCDGLGYGGNTKAAIIRIGLLEMKKFCFSFLNGVKEETFFHSCGMADLITTCYGGRNRKCAEAFIQRRPITWEQLEKELLGGQKLQGTLATAEIYKILQKAGSLDNFPLFKRIYEIAFANADPAILTKIK